MNDNDKTPTQEEPVVQDQKALDQAIEQEMVNLQKPEQNISPPQPPVEEQIKVAPAPPPPAPPAPPAPEPKDIYGLTPTDWNDWDKAKRTLFEHFQKHLNEEVETWLPSNQRR